MHEDDDIKWWEVRYYTQYPFTNTTMMVADNENQALSKFRKSDDGDKQICNVTEL